MSKLILIALSLIATSAQARLRSVDGSDICAVRPDLCDQRGTTQARRVKKVVKRSSPARVANAAARTRSLTCRPSHVEITARNADLPECGRSGRSIASVETRKAAVNFSNYMNQNATNPALSRRIAGYQSAFKEPAKPATLDLSGMVDSSGVRETAPAGNGAPAAAGQAPNNQ